MHIVLIAITLAFAHPDHVAQVSSPLAELAAPTGAFADLPRPVQDFLLQISGIAERHEWDSLLALADESHRAYQVDEMGQAVELYLMELVHLHWEGNEIETPVAVPSRYPYLDRVRSFQFERWESLGGAMLQVSGTITLDDGQRRELLVWVVWSNGQLRLSGALG